MQKQKKLLLVSNPIMIRIRLLTKIQKYKKEIEYNCVQIRALVITVLEFNALKNHVAIIPMHEDWPTLAMSSDSE